jgi:hypothetical protein
MKDALATVEQAASKLGKATISLDDLKGVRLCEDLQKKLEVTK